ncbi:succinylglutamate desuccinylase/aspartoacylase family protein [Maribacter sp. ANRC-HE7]|uniref:Succinylglutamate desuccinylase/aspartoacylase family protein n=1 Tax=Maribacter aquimaris TaxID=2737171 RepID=A0ABR7V8V2_9FLAO|nr:succinylglutamate desuccinylase/aspartoacylase family protein [Maribacter aquimaris]MBD0779747.1 succinylglutamate desuccinylase/aspartoacylase family protein [Maribacter aquimaris]
MIDTWSPEAEIKTKRLIGHIRGEHPGPTLVFFAGIHGNEKAGVTALEKVLNELGKGSFTYHGSIYALKGNLPALEEGKRYLDKDLNRIWTKPEIESIKERDNRDLLNEEKELLELHTLVHGILEHEKGPFYFIDYHTTSSKTLPFITINDALINRRFSKLFPVPIVLGIEEYLDGPLLSYINEKGYVSLGFESGQHTEEMAIKNSIAFTWLAMVYSGFLKKDEVNGFKGHYEQLQKSADNNSSFYEIIYRHHIDDNEDFKMMEGFHSFEEIIEGTPLAMEKEEFIKAEKDTIIFMPLYQQKGNDGFFLIRKLPTWVLKLSAFFRRTKIGNLLHYLPGLSWANKEKESLLVNTKVAQFSTRPFFHLLGYRNRMLDDTHIVMNNREFNAKTEMYGNTWWYRITTRKTR